MSEYAIMAQSLDLKPGILDATGQQIARGLTNAVGKVVRKTAKGIQSLPEGDWNIVSHNLTRIGDHLVVSFLVRR